MKTAVLEKIGLNLDAQAIRDKLAESMQQTDTLRRLLKVVERAEKRAVTLNLNAKEATR